jgi:hypothetical protein
VECTVNGRPAANNVFNYNLKKTVLWDVVIIALMIEAVSTSEMPVNFYQTTWHIFIFVAVRT